MLTAIPARLLHWLRDRAREVVALAELGLALTCPCGGDHGDGPALLGHDECPQCHGPLGAGGWTAFGVPCCSITCARDLSVELAQ